MPLDFNARTAWRTALGTALCLIFVGAVPAARVVLKNGIVLEGDVARLGTLIANPAQGQAPPPGGELIVLVDNQITRSYVSLHQVQEVIDNAGEVVTKFDIPQPVARGGRRVASLGRVLKTEPWDNWGRRTIKLLIAGGPADVIQGITLITPRYYKVETLSAGQRLLIDQRYATSSMPTDLLREILYKGIDTDDPNRRLDVYQLFLEADRYGAAEAELTKIVEDFPDLDLARQLQAVRNLKANRGLRELKHRREAGQHRFARAILKAFPDENIAGETLLEVREILQHYQSVDRRIAESQEDLKRNLAKISPAAMRTTLAPAIDEICGELNSHTLVRLGAYLRVADDAESAPSEKLAPGEKLALAVSGWLLGADDATDNLPVALSLVEVRGMVREYLREDSKSRRDELLTRIRSQEGGVPRLVARLLAHMKPPLELPEPVAGVEGYYEIDLPARDRLPPVRYLVQLPPEYDPYRRYPVIITLHGAGTTAAHQIDWWAGDVGQGGRPGGQAARHGYIVIAPQWAKVKQRKYEYSGREHAAVLDTLRDAARRFAVDTDRVFLSGHSMGGDAVWDIGLAHPDLWAGVIPIVATADSNRYNYNTLYWKNQRYVPFYFVGGDLDGDKLVKNAYQFDRYLRHVGYDVLVVDYQGRGHESFHDEILHLFNWMTRQQRNFFPTDFECDTIRSYDNYFWWVEIGEMPEHARADPDRWPPRRIKSLTVEGKINRTDSLTTVRVRSGSAPTTIWLAPELVDFDQRMRVVVRGFRDAKAPAPDIAVMLEDARTRGDRMHPFWARLDLPE